MQASILIVDDDPTLQLALGKWAQKSGFRINTAETAQQTLDLLQVFPTDLVIVDLKLPDMDGLDLAQRLIEQTPERPVLMMTAVTDLEVVRTALHIGVYEYFTKPFHFSDILSSIHRALDHRSLLLKNQALQTEMDQKVAQRTAELKLANDRLKKEMEERKRAEQQLVRLERLSAVGEIATGISHNLNNILTGILGPAQLLELQSDDPETRNEARQIREATMRAADLVQHLHQFVHGEDEIPQPVPVTKTIEEAIQTTDHLWKDKARASGIAIEILTKLEETPPIRGSQNGLHMVIENLILNAVDAMPEGGTISISSIKEDPHICVTITDTGIGMDDQTRRRLFEPFFTTKKLVGTGLSLSTVYSTITHWGGHIEVESVLGKGTTFFLSLPIWDQTTAYPFLLGENA